MKFFPYSCRVDWTRENLPPTPLATPEPMAAKEKGYTSSTNKIVLFKHCKHLHTGNTTRTGSFRYIRKRPRPPLFHIISTAPIVRLLSRRSRPVPCAAAAMGSSDSQAPLLLPRGSHRKEEEEEYAAAGKVRGCCGGDGEGGWWREATAEAGRLASLAAPMIAVALLQLMMQLISTVMVGHLGEVALAGAAIANSLTNVSGFSVLMGLACGLETICGQAYGAKQYHKLALYMYRSIIVLLVVSVPIAIIWVFIPEVLPLIGQQPEIASEAGKYALWLIPGLFAFTVAQCLSKFLQTQSLIFPMVLSSSITLALFIPLCWFMVYKVGMGNAGAALSVSICDWVEVTVLGLYIVLSPSCEKTRAPLTWEAFSGIGSFLRLAVPSALMICVRVSNELGAGNPEAVLVSVTLLALRHFIGIAFSNEEEVINYVTRMVPVLSVSVITDSLQGVLSGVSRGCGWQHLGAYVNLGAFYLVGVPVALFFGFAMHLGGMGFWMGMVAGGATQVTLLSIITAMTNWGKMAEKARDRVFEERIPTQKAYIIFVLNKEQSILENKHLIAAQTSSRVVTIRFGKNIKSI
uniref:Protein DETOXIFICATION n=1 Tax=Oryza meridionalis TaxID=40149 RepID=A0A0E0C2M1_9ORYZ